MVVSLAGVLLWVCFAVLDADPQPELLRSLAEIGATFLIAYVLEISWLVRAGRRRSQNAREKSLGTLVGVGGTGLLGIAIALVVADRLQLGDAAWVDELAFGWSVAAIGFLGLTVVQQPLVVYEWMDEAELGVEPGTESTRSGPSDSQQAELL